MEAVITATKVQFMIILHIVFSVFVVNNMESIKVKVVMNRNHLGLMTPT
jgi:uncharacterized integral membrane protein